MRGLGTIVNAAAVIIGAAAGLLIKGGLPKRFEETILSAVGLAVIFIGLGGALSGLLVIEDGALAARYTMMTVLSLVLGAVVGELLDIEKRLDGLGRRIKARMPEKLAGNSFVEGFVTASMLFCVGAMAIVGALEDGLNGSYAILFAKSLLDGISAVIFAASLGVGVALSSIPLLVYQGGITLLAQALRPLLTDALIGQMSCIGSILIVAIGVNMIFGKKLKVGNLLPAIFFPAVFALLGSLFPGLPL
ncbi:MAG: DUF554 domain-containing protein [Oscillospiraceae bacterium]|jgi:uncharacterized membrane protein YqgA involved in biofilm formation|nr:DUF554 domain-containing protein [Oscillospiraceae bacterium]